MKPKFEKQALINGLMAEQRILGNHTQQAYNEPIQIFFCPLGRFVIKWGASGSNHEDRPGQIQRWRRLVFGG